MNISAAFQGNFRLPVLICSGLWILILTCAAAAQSLIINPAIAYENAALLAIRRNPGVINRFPSQGFGRSYNNTFWLGSDFTIQGLLPEFDGLIRLRVGASAGFFTSYPYVDSSKTLHTLNEFRVSSRQNLVQLDLFLGYNPLENLVLVAGPWASFRLFSTTVESEHILGPDSAVFTPSWTKDRVIDAGNVLESYPFRIGMAAGIGYNFRLASFLAVQPLVAGRCDLEGLWKGLGRRAFSVDVGASFDIGSGEENSVDPPVLVVDTMAILARQSNITASVDIFNTEAVGSNRDRTPIQTQRTVHRQYMPLPSLIFFDADSEVLPARYQQQPTSTDDKKSQTERNDPARLHQNLLRTLAGRLQETPAGRVTLRGVVAPGESPAAARRRAETVAAYLENSFGVRGSQIVVETGSSRGCGSKFAGKFNVVNITLSPSALLSPLLTQWEVQDYIVPQIGVNKRISSTLGVKHWELAIRQGKEQVGRTSSSNDIGDEFDAVFSLSDFVVDSLAAPLIAELTVHDHVGGKKEVRDELHFEIQKSDAASDREVRTYLFLEPDAECPEMIAINKALISNLVATTRNDARIVITSKGGETSKWNALKVAEQISSVLNQHSVLPKEVRVVHAPPPGSSQKVADTVEGITPEATIYAQSVTVRVEQKLQQNNQ